MWTRSYIRITTKTIILLGLGIVALVLILQHTDINYGIRLIRCIESYGLYFGLLIFAFGILS